jgi:hypothetical protein
MGWLIALALVLLGSVSMSDSPSPSPLAPPAGPPTPDQRAAARDLADVYALMLEPVRAGKQASEIIAELQRRMGGLKVDGFLGPRTRARARELGVTV